MTELDIIETHRMGVSPQQGGGWVIEASLPSDSGDFEIVELARTKEGLRTALYMAVRKLQDHAAATS